MHYLKQIDLSQKISYIKALFLPFRVTPWITILSLVNMCIKLAFVPIEVLATANFIDCSISAIKVMTKDLWKSALIWLALIVLIKIYKYIEEPLVAMMLKKQKEKEWLAIDYPAIKLRASLNIQYIENSKTNDLIQRTSTPAGSLCGMLQNLISFIMFVGGVFSYVIILLSSAPLSGGIILISAIPMIFVAKRSALAQYKAKQDITKQERLVWSLHGYLKNRDFVSERTLFSYFNFIEKKFHKEYTRSRNNVLQAEISWGVRKSISGFMLIVLSAVAIFLLLPSVMSGVLSVGLYISLIGTIFLAAEDVAFNLSPYLEKITADKEFLKEFNQYVQLQRMPEVLAPMSAEPPAFKSLEFIHVSFTYPGTDKQVLNDVSFKIEAGKRYSLIGINGSGKSTIVKLILRLYDDYQGEILLNGILLRDWNLSNIKAMIGAVFQDFIRYEISIADNISVGCNMCANDSEIEKAISVSGLSEFVSRLSDGKNTMLGKIYENGIDLSGGQWQRIAIARAIISHSTLKIFDEPTASLDPMAEREVYLKFDEISKGATSIFISHRLASCVHADMIYLLDNGTIIEKGSHLELLNYEGKYKEMFESQRGWYS